MNVLSVSEMVNLENILNENPFKSIREFKNFKSFEKTYLLRAKKLPVKLISEMLNYFKENNLDKKLLISFLSKHFEISEKEAEKRLKEVQKINRYNLENNQVIVLKQTK